MSFKENDNKSSATYLPLSEQCLKPKFLANEQALTTFVRLVKESHDTSKQSPFMLSAYDSHKKSFTEIFSEMNGLTDDQRTKVTETAKDLEKKQSARAKIGCQF